MTETLFSAQPRLNGTGEVGRLALKRNPIGDGKERIAIVLKRG